MNCFFQIIKLVSRDSHVVKQLKEERRKLKLELQKISMKDNYTEYVKIERNILKIESQIVSANEQDNLKNFLVKYGINYGFKIIIGFTLFLLTIFNRSEAVIVFSERFNFSPLSSIMTYPSKLDNSISYINWLFINNYVFRNLASKIN
jgi:tail-anchored protein insertion receptor